jgi:hypothetical protein
MKLLALLPLLLLLGSAAYAEPLSRGDHAIIMVLAESLGVPRSVADRLQIEESGDPLTGAWGDSEKIGPVGSDGARCLGLYQLNPRVLSWFLANFYPYDPRRFDWRDPIDNAVVALGYMRWLHDRLGTWYLSACAFNAGIGKVWRGEVGARTQAYARRIVEWAGSPEESEPGFEEYPEAFRGAARFAWMKEAGGPGR